MDENCKTCEGTGRVCYDQRFFHSPEVCDVKPCPDCAGKGRLFDSTKPPLYVGKDGVVFDKTTCETCKGCGELNDYTDNGYHIVVPCPDCRKSA